MMSDKVNVPKLRFGEFDRGWKKNKFSDAISITDCKHRTPEYISEGVPVVSPGIIQWGQLVLSDASKLVSIDEALSLMDHCTVRYNDLIFSRNQSVGIASQVKTDEQFVLGQDTVLLQEKGLNIEFVYFGIQTHKFQNQIKRASGGSTFSRINLGELRKLHLCSGTPAEQQKIASFLSKVDEKITLLTEKKAKLAEYKKGVIQQLFNGKWAHVSEEESGQLTFIPPTLRFKADDGSDFPDWSQHSLGNLVSVKASKFTPNDDTDIPCIELENLSQGTGKVIGNLSTDGVRSQKSKFKSGDVLFGRLRPYLRKFAHPTFSGICSGEIWVMSCSEMLSGKYLFQFVQTEVFLTEANKSSGTKMPRADWKVVSEFAFKLPCKQEQYKIANFLSAIDQKIELANSELEKAKEWKKGLLQQMFV